MSTGPQTEYGRRLQRILFDLGYVKKGQLDLDRACTVINRRTLRPLELDRLHALVHDSRPAFWTCDRAIQLAAGLGVDIRELLYDVPPKPGRRPQNLWDELNMLFPVD